jgi:hypothetical protein
MSLNNKTETQEMTLPEKIETVRLLALFPSLSLMVLSRRRLGYRMVRPTWLACMFILLVALGGVAGPSMGGSYLVLFGFLMLGLGLFQRWQRWREIVSGVRWFTYSTGISFLEVLPLPVYLKQFQRIQRFVEPILGYIVGLLVFLLLSRALGVWLLIASAALTIFEQSCFEKQMDRDLDMLDGLFMSEVQAETLDVFSKNAEDTDGGHARMPSIEESAGIPVGMAPDLQKQIARRRKRAVAADNLASSSTGNSSAVA